MGIYDRDYVRNAPSRNPFGNVRLRSVTSWLIAINIAVFILNAIFTVDAADPDGYREAIHPIYLLGFFSVNHALFRLQAWRFITCQFLHADLQHIFFNMLALFFFGPLVEGYLGARRYLAFYLITGIAGPLMYMVLWMLQVPIGTSATQMIGASAGIFGVLIAAAFVAPDTVVMLDFLFPVKLRTFAWGMVAIAAFWVITNRSNAGGEAAHLGGAIAGWGLIKNQSLLNFSDYRRGPRMRLRR